MIIGRLTGTVAALSVDSVLIDVGGVGYVALAGTQLLSKLNVADTAELYIETRVTENSITLFAFATDEERAWFVRLQDVPGVAGKSAMAIIDTLSPGELMDALALGDATTLTRAKGVGKKLAERVIAELSGKPPPMGRFGPFAADPAASAQTPPRLTTGTRGEAVSALINLGYAQSEAAHAVASVASQNAHADVSVLIRSALKALSSA